MAQPIADREAVDNNHSTGAAGADHRPERRRPFPKLQRNFALLRTSRERSHFDRVFHQVLRAELLQEEECLIC